MFLLLKLFHEKIEIHKDTTRCIKFVHFHLFIYYIHFAYSSDWRQVRSNISNWSGDSLVLESKFMSLKLPTDINVVVDRFYYDKEDFNFDRSFINPEIQQNRCSPYPALRWLSELDMFSTTFWIFGLNFGHNRMVCGN